MRQEPRAFFCVDRGTATTAGAIVGRVAGRWRLLGSAALPAAVDADTVLGLLLARLRAADPDLANVLGAPGDRGGGGTVPVTESPGSGDPVDLALVPADLSHVPWPRLEAHTSPPGRLAILAPTERRRVQLHAAAGGSGWVITSVSLERADVLEATTAALRRDIGAVLVGGTEPAGNEERRGLALLGPLLAAVAQRRPGLHFVLDGAATQFQAMLEGARSGGGRVISVATESRPADGGSGLAAALASLRMDPADSRHGMIRATGSLAKLLNRRIEMVEIGASGGARAVAGQWLGRETPVVAQAAIVADAGLVREEPDDELVDGVVGWSSAVLDRARLSDRLRESWLAPWAEAHGDGAHLRLAAARAAVARLVQATPEFDDLPSADMLLVAGGAWTVAPPPAVLAAILDVIRRSGVCQVVLDHARILAPIGTIADDAERLAVLSDLVDDALVPLGTAIVPQGLRSGRYAGRATVFRAGMAPATHELAAGSLVSLDVPPGEVATADLAFRDAVVLGGRGRRFAVDVAGGMAGVVVDLRDIPLRLPDRLERRREQLAEWHEPLWGALEA